MTLRSALATVGVLASLSLAACGDDAETAALAPPPDGVDQAFDGLPGDPDLADIRTVEDAPAALRGARVQDEMGRTVGSVERVETAAGGAVDALVIALDGGGQVRATPLEARYDERANAVALIVGVEDLEAAG